MKHAAWPFAAPFALYVLLLAAGGYVPEWPAASYAVRVLAVAAALLAWSRPAVDLKPARWPASAALGVVVFLVWIGPDLLWPGYRGHFLFQNALTRPAQRALPESLRGEPLFLALRAAGSALLVPVVEELFWRGWLMRYLIAKDFTSVRPGAYTAFSFWTSALLFASEHGPYWDVGLLAGAAYNWWMVRTGRLADCILAHAVTNACLAAYILFYGRWEYWL